MPSRGTGVLGVVLLLLLLVAAAVAFVWTMRVGDIGARAVWNPDRYRAARPAGSRLNDNAASGETRSTILGSVTFVTLITLR